MKLRLPTVNLSLQLGLALLIALIFGDLFSPGLKSMFYSLSLTLKEGLLFVLPAVVFSCIFTCILAQKGRAFNFMAVVVMGVCISNLIATFLAYGISSISFATLEFSVPPTTSSAFNILQPLWLFSLPTWLSNSKALILGAALGSFFVLFPRERAFAAADYLNRFVSFFLQKMFLPVLPIFAFGFILKMKNDGVLAQIISTYLPIVLLILVSNFLYLLILYSMAAGFRMKRCFEYLKNMMPAALMGFTTMSSMAALPVSVTAAEKNVSDPEIARAVVPATVNIHLIGDGIAIPLMAIAVMLTFGRSFPSLSEYSIFAIFFILYKFGAAGMPGASILVMIPILEEYLGFSGEMSALITSLYILFDPIITTSNVLGNGVFVIFLSKFFNREVAVTA